MIPKIVLTGPESTGKTAMSETLANTYGELWAPEFARFYLAHLGRPYVPEDLKTIAAGQKSWEKWYADRARALTICDTDWTVLHVWETFRFGSDKIWRSGYGPAPSADLYLLCAPDFDWQPDPLREHPAERELLFNLYAGLLRSIYAPFVILRGNPEERLFTAQAAIRQL